MEKPAVPKFGNIPVTRFLREVKSELRKVNWPTRDETLKFTFVVIVISVMVAVYIGGLDALFLTITTKTLGR
jgi:preprotein translocase subunit SecE